MVSLLHKKDLCPSTLTDTIHKLISLISDKNTLVKLGVSACVDKNHTVYLPPLPEGATEKDFIKYFHFGTHEQAHIFGESDFIRASKDKLRFGLENALEDIRCEEIQEKPYPGLKPYRIRFYIDMLEDFINDEFSNASPSDIKQFVNTLGKYIIVKVRKIQLDAPHITITASDELIKAYYDYVSDLETRIINMRTSDEMFELSGIIYDRLRDLIKNEMEKKAKEQNEKEKDEQSKSEPGNDQEESSSGKDGEEDEDASSELPNDNDESNGSNESQTTPEKETDDEDSEPEEGNSNSSTEDESEPEENNDPLNPIDGDIDGEEPESSDKPQKISGDQDDNGETEEEDSDASDSDPVDDNSDGDGDDEITPEELDRMVQEVIDDLDNCDDPMDITSKVRDDINNVDPNLLPYMVDPSVKDIIQHGREVTSMEGTMIRDRGLKLLGPKGSQLTKLFISQTKPRTMHNRYKGDFDIISFARDVHDNRDDIYTNISGAKLEKAAISFMVDNSDSMRKIIDYMYTLLSGILCTLSKAQIPTEAIGYTVKVCKSDTWRDIPALITIIKDFKESYSSKVMNKCVAPYSMKVTNDLDGMKYCIPRLWARPEKKKVLMVLCDGEPYLYNHTLTCKIQKSYKEYIEICRKAGIIIFGIGIGDLNLSKYFGEDWVSVGAQNVGETLLSKLTQILNRR